MKTLISLTFCCLLATGVYAQRGGGGRGGFGGGGGGRGGYAGGGGRGGYAGGGMRGGFTGGGVHGGYIGGGIRGGYIGGGVRNGFVAGGVRTGWGGGWGFGRGWGYGYWPYGGGFGASLAYWPGYYSGYYWPGYYDYGWNSAYYPNYASSYASSPNVTVVYPETAPAPAPSTVYVERARPVMQVYDEYGQERQAQDRPTGQPIYLIAFRDHAIRAAVAYWVEGKSLVYVTLEHEQKTAPLDMVDRGLSQQLNRERRVPFQLP